MEVVCVRVFLKNGLFTRCPQVSNSCPRVCPKIMGDKGSLRDVDAYMQETPCCVSIFLQEAPVFRFHLQEVFVLFLKLNCETVHNKLVVTSVQQHPHQPTNQPTPPHRFYLTIGIYASRWVVWYLAFDFFLHYLPVYALIRGNVAQKLVEGGNSALAIKLSYWILPVLWMKFLLMWRFFRLWSLAMGVDCLENMPVGEVCLEEKDSYAGSSLGCGLPVVGEVCLMVMVIFR